MIRILLIDELAVVRESLAMALGTARDMELWCSSTIEEGSELLNGSPGRFDVVLVKQSAGGQKVDELLSITNQNGLNGRVLIITPGLSELEQTRLARLGVAGIFAKQRPLVELIDAIRGVAREQPWFDRQASHEDPLKRALSRQERTAADLVLEGLANKEIAVRMVVSESCVKALLQRVFLKVGVRTRGQLVRFLMERSPGALMEKAPEAQFPSDLVHLAGSMDCLGTGEAADATFELS
jgi:two-component system response regulator NreC